MDDKVLFIGGPADSECLDVGKPSQIIHWIVREAEIEGPHPRHKYVFDGECYRYAGLVQDEKRAAR